MVKRTVAEQHRHRIVAFLIALVIACASGEHARAAPPTPPGGLSGTFESSIAASPDGATGAMVYGIPFALPAARGNAQPSLGLSYRSGRGTGDAGESWSLGIPAVERAPLSAFPRYVDNGLPGDEDRYVYGGQALTYVCTVGGQTDACPTTNLAMGAWPTWASGYRYYRRQVDGPLERFFLSPDREHWTVQERGGVSLEFGRARTRSDLGVAAVDRDERTSRVFRWNLARAYDLHGTRNLTVYTWADLGTAARKYLTDVHYTPPAAAWATAALSEFAFHVQLSWHLPTPVAYQHGKIDKRRHQLRLRRVAIASKTWSASPAREVLRIYHLSYFGNRSVPGTATEAPTWNRSYLRDVTEEGRCLPTAVAEVNGVVPEATGCPTLPAMTFEYQAANLVTSGSFVRSAAQGASGVDLNDGLKYPANTSLVDIHHDGLPDIVQGWPQSHQFFGYCSAKPSKRCLPSTRLTDCGADGGQCLGAVDFYYPDCFETGGISAPNGEIDWSWFFVRTGSPPQVACQKPPVAIGPEFSPELQDIRSARAQIAYVNRGPAGVGGITFQHNCLDADALVAHQFVNSALPSQTALFSQWGAEASGAWGDAFLLWTKSAGRGFGVESTGAAGTFCANAAGGASNYPALRWAQTTDTFWAKKASTLVDSNLNPLPMLGFVDIDGDGLLDQLSPTAPNGIFESANIRFSRRLSHLEMVDGIRGPALVPFAGDISGATGGTYGGAELSVGRARDAAPGYTQFVYADIDGDGVVDLVTYDNPNWQSQQIPIVRPGNGRGHFGCEGQPDPTCGGEPALEAEPATPAIGKGYRISVPDADKPWPLMDTNNVFTAMAFFHDVTGDGLADIVKLEHGLGGLIWKLRLWVNVDGHTFRCANNANQCVVATLADADKPTADPLSYRATFADLDGNGSEDFVLLGKTGVWHFSFIEEAPLSPGPRGSRPGLLTRIRNGLGADTEITYQTIQELDRAAQDPDAQSFKSLWRSHSAQVVPVVTKIVNRDTAQVIGSGLPQPYGFTRTTKYSYRNPAYDPWERAFKGFTRVRVSQTGGHVVETRYWFSNCNSWRIDLCSQTSDGAPGSDSVPKALSGLPRRIDRYLEGSDERPLNWFSTTTLKYEVGGFEAIGTERDRNTTFPRVTEVHQHLYDTTAEVSNTPDVEIGGPDTQLEAPFQASAVHLVTTTVYDAEGNVFTVKHEGRLQGATHLDSIVTESFNQNRCSSGYVPSNGEWACLVARHTVDEQRPPAAAVLLRDVQYKYDNPTGLDFEGGDLRKITVRYKYNGGLERHPTLGTGAPPDAITSPDEWRTPLTFERDEFGNALRTYGSFSSGSQPCTDVVFDDVYRQLPQTVTAYAETGCSGSPLTTQLTFDRGLGAPTMQLAPNTALTTIEHDAFGRVSKVFASEPDVATIALRQTLEIAHFTTAPVPYAVIRRFVGIDDSVDSVEIFNGLGEHVLGFDEADTIADGAPWIARSWQQRDAAGRVVTQHRPWFFSGDPVAVASSGAAIVPPTGIGVATEYDAFHRPTFHLEELGPSQGWLVTRAFTHGPLTVDVKDAEQAKTSGPYAGLSSTVFFDGHGRVEKTIARGGVTAGTRTTKTKYLGTGEPIEICRYPGTSDVNCTTGPTADTYVRTMQWDTAGRLRENIEPNTRIIDAQGSHHWRYVYDDADRLVGTSDARGCGKNIYYDSLSRVIAEDFSPCDESQPPYTAPNLITGEGTEVFNRYDTYEAGQVVSEAGFDDRPEYAAGRLTAIKDRGGRVLLNYDSRGRVRRETKKLAKPGAPASALGDRYASNVFTQRSDFDLGTRLTKRSTGLVDNELLVNGKSEEAYAYSARGTLMSIGGSYGTLMSGLQIGANGNLLAANYGDAANTRLELFYDGRDRLKRAHVSHPTAPSIWSNPPPGYSTPPAETTQLDLADHFLTLDDVSNPTAIADLSTATWPSGAKAVNRAMQYDGLYRLTQIQYSHGADEHVVPFAPEASAGDRHPVAEVRGASRVQQQNIAYDGHGNTTSTTDNESLRYDRSLGTITNGTFGLNAIGPNRLIDADGTHADYDGAGNLRELTVARSSCWPAMPNCSHRFKYDWDEVGQLLRARRWDYAAGAVPSLDPLDPPDWDLSYAYSGGARTRTSVKEGTGAELHTLDVFATLRIKAAEFLSGQEYQVRVVNEIGFVGGLGRVFYDEPGGLPKATGSARHLYLHIGDHLGSTSIVIDKDSGELVERTTYQAFGALDSDFRPTRWQNFRAENKFTGKEEDIEVGLTYFGARYYQAHLGRWASADPLTIHGLGADLNPYAYVRGRVMSHVDPFGLRDIDRTLVTWWEEKPVPNDHGMNASKGEAAAEAANLRVANAAGQVLREMFTPSWVRGVQLAREPTRPGPSRPWTMNDAKRGAVRGLVLNTLFLFPLYQPADANAGPADPAVEGAVSIVPLLVTGLGGMGVPRIRAAPQAVGAGFPGWPTIGETPGGAVGQMTSLSCGAACGEMVSGIPQATLLPRVGAPAAPAVLGRAIGGRGGYVGPGVFPQLVGRGQPWIAMMRGRDALHYVVVDGVEGGNVLIRDPWAGGSTYSMTQGSFDAAWTGVAVGDF